MDLIILILLTVWVWRRGWGRRALLPVVSLVVVAVFAGFLIGGMAVFSSSFDEATIRPIAMAVSACLTVAAIGALVIMGLHPWSKAKDTPAEEMMIEPIGGVRQW